MPLLSWFHRNFSTCPYLPFCYYLQHPWANKEVFVEDLQTIFTPPTMLKALLLLISGMDYTNTSSPNKNICKSIDAQTKLGWHQFCLGRISIKWRSTYESLYDPKNHLKPLTWVSHLVLAIWSLTQKIWKCWNRIVHDIKLTSQMSQHMSQSHAKVTYMYQNFLNDPFQIPQHLRYLFDRPLSLLLGMSEDATKCWIVTVNEAIRTKSLIHHANAYSRKFMARFLGKENTPPPSQSHKPTKDRIQIQYQSDQTKH